MPENPEEDIVLPAIHPILRDGFGSSAMIIKSSPGVDNQGKETITFTLLIDDFIKKVYNLKFGKDYDARNRWNRIVYAQDVVQLRPYDMLNQIWQYEKSFNYEETPLSKRTENLKIEIDSLMQKNRILEAENIRLSEDLLLYRTNPEQVVAQGSEVFEKSMKNVADILRPKENK